MQNLVFKRCFHVTRSVSTPSLPAFLVQRPIWKQNCYCYWSFLQTLKYTKYYYTKSFFKKREFRNQISDGIHQCLLRSITLCRLNPQYEFVLQWMWLLVTSKQHIGILQQLTARLIKIKDVICMGCKNFVAKFIYNFLLM